MTTDSLEIGVCSWALDRHDVLRAIDLAGGPLNLRIMQIGFFTAEAVQDADPGKITAAAESAGVTIVSSFVAFEGEDYSSIARIAETGGYGSDRDYSTRLALTRKVAELTKTLSAKAVAVHIGTVPADPGSPMFAKLAARVGEVADCLQEFGLRLHIETGRESADTLVSFLDTVNRPNIGVNFDPGNFIVYGTDDPGHALQVLGNRIEGVHAKDARRSARPGIDYGGPAALGTGDVDLPGLLADLRNTGYCGPLLIECGSRDAGLDTVATAAEVLLAHMSAT